MFGRRAVLATSRGCQSAFSQSSQSTTVPAIFRAIQTSRAVSATLPTIQTEVTTQSHVPPPTPASRPSRVESLFPEQLSPPSPSAFALLEALRQQPPHYLTIHINGFPFLVTVGDKVTLPFVLKDVRVGDVLRLTHASVLGSREFTMQGNPWIDSQFFECRARVTEVTSEPMRLKEKKKQRTRRTTTVRSKHKYTVITISELAVKGVDQLGA